MRLIALAPVFPIVLWGLVGCRPSEPTVGAGDTTSVALEDTLAVPVMAVARLESDPEDKLEVGITYPQLNPSVAPELATMFDAVNGDIAARVAAQVDTFMVAARYAATNLVDPEERGFSSLEGTYADPFVNDRIFSASQEVYRNIVGTAHPTTTTLVYNYDLGTGAQLGLEDIFNGATAYLDTLSARAGDQIVAVAETRGIDPGGLHWEGFGPLPENFARFTLSLDSLRLHFPPDTVAPYAAGPFIVVLAYSDLRRIMADVGAAATLGNN